MMDETTMKVLDKTKKGITHCGYYWAVISPQKKMVYFEYHPGRDQDGIQSYPERFQRLSPIVWVLGLSKSI
jgi:hypothetical protein